MTSSGMFLLRAGAASCYVAALLCGACAEPHPVQEPTSQASLTASQEPAADNAPADTPVVCQASPKLAPGDSTVTVTVGETTRNYVRHVPPSYDGQKPMPVVIDFHPLSYTGAAWKDISGWTALADQEGFIMVWPEGIGKSWNVGRCCPPAMEEPVDDVAFVRALLAQLQDDACVDPKRVYATGCSNGGGMTYKVACEAADLVAAVAPVDFDCVVGPDNKPSCGGCNPTRPIAAIQFRATADKLVHYNGGPAPIPKGMDFPGAEANFSAWAEINQCVGEPEPLPGHPDCQTLSQCGGTAQTTLCTVKEGGHCRNYKSFGIPEIAWESFKNQQLP